MIDVEYNSGTHSFYGAMEFTVVAGNPVLMGAELSPGYHSTVFAPISHLPLSFESKACFKLRIKPVDSSILLYDEIRLYYPSSLPSGYKKISPGIYYSQFGQSLNYPGSVVSFSQNIAKSKDKKVVMIIGAKGTGKSTYSRYLINNVLNTRDRVCYIDIDCGQPEFSIPGTISATVLEDYSFNPPEMNVKKSTTTKFLGIVTMSQDPMTFIKSAKELFDEYSSEDFIVINSFGWLIDIGLTIHQELINHFQPTNIVGFYTPESSLPALSQPVMGVDIQSGYRDPVSLTSKSQRELRIVSYLTRGQGAVACQTVKALNARDFVFHMMNKSIPLREITTALNGSIIAFGHTEKKYQGKPFLYKCTRNIKGTKTIGYGIVRGFSHDKSRIYVSTSDDIAGANVIILGRLQTPPAVFKETPRCEPSYLGIGMYSKAGASTDPLVMKYETKHE